MMISVHQNYDIIHVDIIVFVKVKHACLVAKDLHVCGNISLISLNEFCLHLNQGYMGY